MYQRLINEEEPEEQLQNEQNFELKNRHSKERRPLECIGTENEQSKIDFLNHTVKPNETLQGIALRYGCSVSKLRLYNHLMTDHAFHGLAVLKIPVIPNSVLKERYEDQSVLANSTPFVDDLVDVSDQTNPPIAKTQVVNIGISNYLRNNGSEDYQKFLNNLSEDFREIRKSTLLRMESSSQPSQVESQPATADASLGQKSEKAASSAFLSCDGSDFGIHWRYLILILIIVCLLVPSYVLFFLEHHNSTESVGLANDHG